MGYAQERGDRRAQGRLVPIDLPLLRSALDEADLTAASLVLRHLDGPSEASLSIAGEAPINPASMLKVPLVAAALAQASEGVFSLDDLAEISACNMTANDTASPLVPGYRSSIRELCERAIERSDNVATNQLFDLLGRECATNILRERFDLRATGFYRKLSGSDPLIRDDGWDGVHRNTHPASDAAKLLSLIATHNIPYAHELHGMLARQFWNEKLTLGLEPGDQFAHKTGDTSEVTHDGGILTTHEGRVYILVVYAALESNERHHARFGALMRTLRPHL